MAQQQVAAVLGSGCQDLVLDLGAADYVDSHGVRWLETLHRQLRRRRAQLRLRVTAGSRVDRTLRLLDADQVLEISRRPQADS